MIVVFQGDLDPVDLLLGVSADPEWLVHRGRHLGFETLEMIKMMTIVRMMMLIVAMIVIVLRMMMTVVMMRMMMEMDLHARLDINCT